MKIIFVLVLSSALIINCSKSKDSPGIPGTGLPTLSLSQEDTTLSFNEELSDVAAVTGNSIDKKLVSKIYLSAARSQNLNRSESQKELQQKMNWAIENSHCLISSQESSADDSSQNLELLPSEITATISGNTCPIAYSLNIKTTPTETESVLNLNVVSKESFSVNALGVVDLNLDIKNYSANTTMNVKTSGKNEESFQLKMSLTNQGKATSLSYGSVTQQINMNVVLDMKMNGLTEEAVANQYSITMTISQAFADFKVVGHLTSKGPLTESTTAYNSAESLTPNETYYINGKEVAKEKFLKIFGNQEVATLF